MSKKPKPWPQDVLEIRVRYYDTVDHYLEAKVQLTREYLEDSIMGPRHAVLNAFLDLWTDVDSKIPERAKP